MKVTVIIGVLLALALVTLEGDAGAVAAELSAVTTRAAHTPEPAILLLSGATLLAVASVVRRYVR
jgi:hypothetical protein